MLTLLIIFIWIVGAFASYAFASRVVPFLLDDTWTDLDRKFASVLSLATSWGMAVILVFFLILGIISALLTFCSSVLN